MNKDFLIQLTNDLYKLTLLFPKKEPLRYKMREVADEILDRCLRQNLGQNPVMDDLEVLDSFFEVAKAQNWVAAAELLRIQEEYNKIKAEIKKNVESPPEPPKLLEKPEEKKTESRPAQTPTTGGGGLRQGKILEFLKENGRAQVWQVKQVFPEVTKRTLRRDFESMLKQGIIERVGERNDTFYELKES
ncbi:MAG TPA: DeoR family transcriptional regulator [Candidatus Humimicrobiaceae bacterium]|nr:DeoR family transcriptional regulator [Candidatus Humimicrobiaceae bacterium]